MRGSEKTWKDLACNFVHFLVSSYISILTFIDNNTLKSKIFIILV